jgi:hypothetical protein
MNDRKLPTLEVLKLEERFSQEYLDLKCTYLQDKILALGQSAKLEIVQQIQSHLTAAHEETNLRKKADLCELAYEVYISVASGDDLLNIFLGLRARTYRLDRPSREIWLRQKLDDLEKEIRQGNVTAGLRSEVESLAKAIYECGFRYTRDKELKSELLRFALKVDIVAYLIVIILFVMFGIMAVAPESPFQVILIGSFGVSGGLLSATLQLRQRRFYRHYLKTELVGLFFRAVFGAVAAVIVIMFLRLRFIDFPFLHTSSGDVSSIPPTALYVIGFASGFTDRIFFGAIGKVSIKSGENAKEDTSAS